MKPGDGRLIRSLPGLRLLLGLAAGLGIADTLLLVGEAWLLALIVARAPTAPGSLAGPLVALAVILVGRGLLPWLREATIRRRAAEVKANLRRRLLAHLIDLGGPLGAGLPSGELAALLTHGLDDLDPYLGRYLPTLVLAVVVPPLVVVALAMADPFSAVVVAATLPLILVLMALVGWATETRRRRRWLALGRLAHVFLDLLAGLPTLRVYGRALVQETNLARLTDAYRRETMATLRVAFLSALVLELFATLSVALVAVEIGLRLVAGGLDLGRGLFILVLAPEAYGPLRRLGPSFHAAEPGLAAGENALGLLDRPVERGGGAAVPPWFPEGALHLEEVTVVHQERGLAAPWRVSGTIRPGEVTALVGPSGVGKSTLLAVLLGLRRPDQGEVVLEASGERVALEALALADWRRRTAWLPHDPWLLAGTVETNLRLAAPAATDHQLRAALAAVGLAGLDLSAPVGEGGAGLSSGQRRRLGLARVLLRDVELVLLDEPTAGLDAVSEAAVLDAVAAIARRGAAVVLVAHRPEAVAVAQRVIQVRARPWDEGLEVPNPSLSDGRRSDDGAALGGSRGMKAGLPHRLTHDGAIPKTLGSDQPNPDGSSSPGPVGERPMAAPARGVAGDGMGEPHAGEEPLPTAAASLLALLGAGRPLARRLVLAAIVGAAAGGSGVALTAVSAWLIATAAGQPPILSLLVAITTVRALGIGRGLLRYLERLTGHDAALRILALLRLRVYRRLVPLVPEGLAHVASGDLLARFVSDVDGLVDLWLRLLLPLAGGVVVVLAAAAGLGWLLPEAGILLVAAAGVALVGGPAATVAARHHRQERLAPAQGRLAALAVETLSAAPELLLLGASERALHAVAAADRVVQRAEGRAASTEGAAESLVGLATGSALWLTVGAGVAAVAAGRLAPVALAVIALTPLAVAELLAGLVPSVAGLPELAARAQRVDGLLARRPPVATPEVTVPRPAGPYGLRLRRLVLRHQEGPPLLGGLDLEIPPGSWLLVRGPSGCGKSTLAAALVRFLSPTEGAIELVGSSGVVDLGRISEADLRATVALAFQDPHVFDSTLGDNLRIARPEATAGEIEAALAAAQLAEWVATLPQGLETPVGEHGSRLSSGQRQRLELARVLLSGAPILVFDEPTEHLDLETALAFLADLRRAAVGRTVVVMGHRDELLTLPWDRVVELPAWWEGSNGSALPSQREPETVPSGSRWTIAPIRSF